MSTGRLINGGLFSLGMSPSLAYMREHGTRYHPSNMRGRDAYGGDSVCVSGGISLSGRTDLLVFPRGTVNAQTYRNDVLDAYVRLYAGTIGDDFLLQDDNARTHIVNDHLQQETIQRIECQRMERQLDHRT
ncbi:hypothetical protein AVEN_137853-1 [Araneus ventricosus]|uniref:Tc1-like transposase DDE domain-containing protein n=1 Tax=Araneus ventricosus TaxID=182803 RepID=A0A4Y2NHA1_ARAVE|nr:hypothetical protein AVEN_137853-1 [Araneus ventricosus]